MHQKKAKGVCFSFFKKKTYIMHQISQKGDATRRTKITRENWLIDAKLK